MELGRSTGMQQKKDPKSGQLILLGKGQKKGKVSNANLGNVTPSFTEYGDNASGPDPLKVQQLTDSRFNLLLDSPDALKQLEARKGQMAAGGASIEYAEQVTTLSLIVLRRLRLPVCKKKDEKDDAFSIRAYSNAEQAGRVVLAALQDFVRRRSPSSAGIWGFVRGVCSWPDGAMEWELLDKPGSDQSRFPLTGEQATILLQQAVDAAKTAGLEWEEKNPSNSSPS